MLLINPAATKSQRMMPEQTPASRDNVLQKVQPSRTAPATSCNQIGLFPFSSSADWWTPDSLPLSPAPPRLSSGCLCNRFRSANATSSHPFSFKVSGLHPLIDSGPSCGLPLHPIKDTGIVSRNAVFSSSQLPPASFLLRRLDLLSFLRPISWPLAPRRAGNLLIRAFIIPSLPSPRIHPPPGAWRLIMPRLSLICPGCAYIFPVFPAGS